MDSAVREKVLENLKKCNIDKLADTIDPAQTMLRYLCMHVQMNIYMYIHTYTYV